MITALEVFRSLPRYAAAQAVAARFPGLVAGPIAPLRLVHRPTPDLPGPDWVRVRPRLAGICGSDLATLAGASARYFSALVSFPFVPGHEVVGELAEDCADLPAGARVVLDPLLSCTPRGLPRCPACAAGDRHQCERVTAGHLAPGLQTGYCATTGGGWSEAFVAHRSQLHPVPDALPDERAVLVEPLACALHVAARAAVPDGARVLVVGAGAVGLLTVLALRATTGAGPILAVAKHPAQVRLARTFGATEVLSPTDVLAGVRRTTRALRLTPDHAPGFLLGGVDVAIDAAGSRTSLDTALRTVRAGGRVVLAGMPAPGADYSPAWFREISVVGAYAGGPAPDGSSSFNTAVELAGLGPLDGLIAGRYPLSRWREAVDHAQSAGRLGGVKVVFEGRGRVA